MPFIGPSGYYEGDQVSPSDLSVPQRPDATHVWLRGAWVQDASLVAASKPRPTPLQWLLRLSDVTKRNLEVAARTDADVAVILRMGGGVTTVDVTDPLTIQSVNALKAKTLLT